MFFGRAPLSTIVALHQMDAVRCDVTGRGQRVPGAARSLRPLFRRLLAVLAAVQAERPTTIAHQLVRTSPPCSRRSFLLW